jgi:hypothetical protein
MRAAGVDLPPHLHVFLLVVFHHSCEPTCQARGL